MLGLVTQAGDNRRITGVRLARGERGGVEETLPAGLVVDAGGRGSRSPAWLEELGYGRLPVDEVQVRLGYSTCYFRRRPEHLGGRNGVVLTPTPPDKRMGVMLAQDGNRWVVTLGAYLGGHVPADYQDFLQAARDLPVPDIYHVIRDAGRLTGPVVYNFRANVRHRYEKLNPFPAGYLVLGDALCSFNPSYAQGMTVAALEAVALDECLASGRDRLAERFFVRAGKIIDVSWGIAVGSDLGFAEVEGPRPPMVRFFNWYLRKLHVAAHADARVSIAFLRVTNMLAPPPSILQPRILSRVIKGNLAAGRRRRGAANQIVDDQGIALDVPGERAEPSHRPLKEHTR